MNVDQERREKTRENVNSEVIREFEEEVQKGDEEHDENKHRRLSDIDLPDGVKQRVLKQYIGGAVIALFSLFCCIAFKEVQYLIGFAIAAGVIYLGISTKLDYANGKIEEIPVICASVNTLISRNKTRVIFRTNEEIPTYYEFLIPGKTKEMFQPNFAYVIYFDPSAPKNLIGYVAL